MITLETKKREKNENLFKLREEGLIPAVFYGPKEESTTVSIPRKDFEKVWLEAGESTVITLKGDGFDHEAMIHDVSRDPLSNNTIHVDFYVVEKGKTVSVHVPIEFDGVAPAVKEFGGILVKVLHEIEVEALPKDLPHSVHVDIGTLVNFDSHVVASDVILPAGVSLVTKSEEIVALVSAPKEEVEETAPVDLSSIEVEKKGKEEEAEGSSE